MGMDTTITTTATTMVKDNTIPKTAKINIQMAILAENPLDAIEDLEDWETTLNPNIKMERENQGSELGRSQLEK